MRLSQGPASGEQAAVFRTRLGWTAVSWRDDRLRRVVFGHASRADAWVALDARVGPSSRLTPAMRGLIQRLRAAAGGRPDAFADVPIDLTGRTPFQLAVIDACRRIPRGQVVTYGQLAAQAGFPGRARAVGNVMASNQVPLVVPCHRVVAANGQLGGFSAPAGIDMKCRLLRLEDVPLPRRPPPRRQSRVPLAAEMC